MSYRETTRAVQVIEFLEFCTATAFAIYYWIRFVWKTQRAVFFSMLDFMVSQTCSGNQVFKRVVLSVSVYMVYLFAFD